MSKPRRAPDWPKSLELAPNPEASRAMTDAATTAGIHLTVPPQAFVMRAVPEPITAIALGTLKDGRHAALELQVSGREVLSARLLFAEAVIPRVAECFRECAYLALYNRTPLEAVPLEAALLAAGTAVALPLWKGKPAALAFDVEGRTVTEPKVVATGDRLFAWDSLDTWIAVNVLPREKKR